MEDADYRCWACGRPPGHMHKSDCVITRRGKSMANNKTYPVQSQRSPAGLYCDRVKTTADAEKKALAIVPSDGFNWAFEELIVERVSDLLALGLSKEIVLKLLDLAVEVEKAKR